MDLSGAVEGWAGGFRQSWAGGGGLGVGGLGGHQGYHPGMTLPRAATYDSFETPGVVTYDGSWDLRTVVGRGGCLSFC